jgi:membrane protease subunit (stomatin/prohibitin family)
MMRRPVLRTVGRTAVIAGTATAVAGGVNRRQQRRFAQQEAAAQPAAAPPPADAPSSDDLVNKLKELANLKDQGILTEAEFADQKTKILAEMS